MNHFNVPTFTAFVTVGTHSRCTTTTPTAGRVKYFSRTKTPNIFSAWRHRFSEVLFRFNSLLALAVVCTASFCFVSGAKAEPTVNPSAPTSITASNGTSTNNILVTWSPVIDALSYKVFRFKGQIPEQIGSVFGNSFVSFADTTANSGTFYSYYVTAVSLAGESLPSTSSVGWKNISAPINLVASNGLYSDQVLLIWDKVSDATGYKVFRTVGGAPATQIGETIGRDFTTFSDTNVISGQIYTYFVKSKTLPGVSLASASDVGFLKFPSPSITGATPTLGSVLNTTAITITGTNFIGATGVTVDGREATNVVVVNATTITATTPTGTAGAKPIIVTTPSGSTTQSVSFTYIAVPTITSVSPASGPLAAGTTITITGTNLTGATNVKVGGVAATVLTNSATTITASTPTGTAGAQSVAVTTIGGTATKASAFTYVALPTISSVSPPSGPLTAGTAITITGTNLTGAISVKVGGVAATNISITATSITAKTPAGTDGAKDVVVTTFGGMATKSGAFTYIALPTIASVSPASGPLAAGTTITITGTNLTGATNVKVGRVAATVLTNSGTTITASTPSGTAGAQSVEVTTIGGTATKASAFTYVALPTITSVSPPSGPLTAGTSITIAGTNFVDGATTVKVGGVAASNVLVVSSTSITALTPANAVGAKDVVVTTAGGVATKTAAFTYVALPTITTVAPISGPVAGGTTITITGTNLTGATSVKVGSVAATILTNTATVITATTPAGTAGAQSVAVTTIGGTATKASAFTYVALPTIASVSPTSGPLTAGTSITIAGTNLTGATVTVGGVAATSVVATATSITAKTPAGTAGAKDVVVTTAGGVATKTAAFTYVALPTIASVSPTSGPLTAGTSITIAGTNFVVGATTVKVGGVAATSVVATATSITAVTPAGTAGAKDVVVTTAGGVATKTAAFTYVALPTITTVAPISGPVAGGTTITITGTNLTGATSVKVGSVAATILTNTATVITATTPAGTAGAQSVAVTTIGGTATKASAFTYVALPTIASVSPTSGPLTAGTSITIAGTNLTGATVTVGGVAATSVVATATSITAKTPAGTAGAKDVVVTTAGGVATKTAAFTYVALPTITTVTPISGPVTGGTTITITGTNLTGATSVKVGGVAATLLSNTSTLISARTPAGTAGLKSITVTTAGGTATKANAFTYVASFTSDETDSNNTNDGGSVVSGKNNKGNDTSAGQSATHAATDDVASAHIGVALYLQTVAQYGDSQTLCDELATDGTSSAMLATTLNETSDITVDTEPQPIDLDHNGEADICQLRRGDLDLDGSITELDIAILLDMVDSQPTLGIGDLDGNDVVDSADISMMLLLMPEPVRL